MRGGGAARKGVAREDEEGKVGTGLGIAKNGKSTTGFAAQIRSSSSQSSSSGGGAFWESMAAVYHDEGYLTFYSPVAVPFDPFREGGALHGRGSDGNSSSVADVAAADAPALSLRGIAVGGAHTFVYGSLTRQRAASTGSGGGSGVAKEEEQEEGSGQTFEFPETPGNGRRGGWRTWRACPNLGCRSVLPDELADWHRVLCDKPPPPPKLEFLATTAASESAASENAASEAAASDGLSERLAAAEDAAGGEHRRLPPLRPGGHPGGPTVLEKVSAARRKFEDESATAAAEAPSPGGVQSPLRTKVVKKRVGGGYAYVTVPDLQLDPAAAAEAPAPCVLGFKANGGMQL